jgi:hypothetical protein
MSIRIKYRFLKGASWGIAIDLEAIVSPIVKIPAHAWKIFDNFWLADDSGSNLTEEEKFYLGKGLESVEHDILRLHEEPLLIRLTDLDYNPTDYQPEGLAAAIAEWVATYFQFSKPDFQPRFDKKLNRYIFGLPAWKNSHASSIGDLSHLVDFPLSIPVTEIVLPYFQRYWPDAYFWDANTRPTHLPSLLGKPWFRLTGSNSPDFFIYRGRITDKIGSTKENRYYHFLVNQSNLQSSLRCVTVIPDRMDNDLTLLDNLRVTCWADLDFLQVA